MLLIIFSVGNNLISHGSGWVQISNPVLVYELATANC